MFVVAAVTIGQEAGAITSSLASALVAAGIITVIVFPTTASALLRRGVRGARGDLAMTGAVGDRTRHIGDS